MNVCSLVKMISYQIENFYIFRGYGHDKVNLHSASEGKLDETHWLQNLQQHPDRGEQWSGEEIWRTAAQSGQLGELWQPFLDDKYLTIVMFQLSSDDIITVLTTYIILFSVDFCDLNNKQRVEQTQVENENIFYNTSYD